MSLSRALFNEFRPLFRMLEDPFAMDSAFSALTSRQRYGPFNWQSTVPALNLSEENDHYVVEAEVPGVRKENLGLRIGDGGRSLTIEGKVTRGEQDAEASAATTTGSQQAKVPAAPTEGSFTAVTKTQDSNQEVADYTGGGWGGTRTFTRTVWLPHRIDSNSVKAKLDHGVLTVTAGKAKDESISINVD